MINQFLPTIPVCLDCRNFVQIFRWGKTRCRINLLVLIIFTVIISLTDAQSARDCQIQFRKAGSSKCLDEVIQLAKSETAYWFGRDLESRCDSTAQADITNVNCYLGYTGPRKYSIIQKIFSVDPQIDHFDSYLTVTYASPEGNYTACGGDFRMPRAGVDVNPDMPAMWAWYYRNPPTFNFPVQASTYYTIVIMDVASGDVLGAVINYPVPEVAVPYTPPINPRNVTAPGVFVVFRQAAGSMQISQKWLSIMTATDSGKKFDLSNFALDQQLQGPVSMNIMNVDRDPWSAEQYAQRGGPNLCAQFIAEGLKKFPYLFLQSMTKSTIDSFLALQFTSPASTFSVCCEDFAFTDTTVTVNPLNDVNMPPLLIRAQPAVGLKVVSDNSSAGRLYSLIALDPTISNNGLATPDKPFAHWLAMNIQLGTNANPIPEKNVVLSYSPLVPPPQSPPHTVFFLLFEQQAPISTENVVERYSDPVCADYLKGRCLFQIKDFIAANGLILRAASWINVINDAYSRYWLIKSGQVETDICSGQPVYHVPCLVPGSSPGKVILLGSGSSVLMAPTTLNVVIAFLLLVLWNCRSI
ncbi:uncharacterized protein C56G2.4-like [Paramacrobiotus metropolitanus]|uniref:uncharacterized protein C56G2.4-like n=1 Tax=Paramacrobiotus metropolitanus TaxID=2943436 RepID=UPI002445A98D|nr:uncharacterized protein C56G2.4-like [Paramacrobiotus metropolitanus]